MHIRLAAVQLQLICTQQPVRSTAYTGTAAVACLTSAGRQVALGLPVVGALHQPDIIHRRNGPGLLATCEKERVPEKCQKRAGRQAGSVRDACLRCFIRLPNPPSACGVKMWMVTDMGGKDEGAEAAPTAQLLQAERRERMQQQWR